MCQEAKEYGFGALRVNGSNVSPAVHSLTNSDIKVGAVIGFYLGAVTSLVKAAAPRDAIAAGAREVDIVINIGRLKWRDLVYVKRDLQGVVDVADGRAVVKVIIETGLLTKEEKVEHVQ